MQKVINRVMFIGSKQIGLNFLKKIYGLSPDVLCGCITYDDRKETRSVYDQILDFCHENKISYYSLTGKCDIGEIININRPELCFVIGWYFIIKKEILDIVPYGFLGLHASLLPEYRGHAPLVWAMINGEKETGYSIFRLEDGVDTGELLYRQRIKIEESDYISDVLKKVETGAVKFLDAKYNEILRGELHWIEQTGNGSFGARRIEDDGLIDWEKDAETVYNFVRAQSFPYPGAYTIWKGKKLIIWRVKKVSGIFYGTCGQIAYIEKKAKSVGIICGNQSAIELELVEWEGVKYQPIEILKSLNIRFG